MFHMIALFACVYSVTVFYYVNLLNNEKRHRAIYLKMLGEIHRQNLYDLLDELPTDFINGNPKLENARNFIQAASHTDPGIVELVLGMASLSKKEIVSVKRCKDFIHAEQQRFRNLLDQEDNPWSSYLELGNRPLDDDETGNR